MDLRLVILKKMDPRGLSAPDPGAIYMYISDIQRCSSLKPLGQSKPRPFNFHFTVHSYSKLALYIMDSVQICSFCIST